MADQKRVRSSIKLQFSSQWWLIILILGVLILSSLAFIQPNPQKDQLVTPSPSLLTATAGEATTDTALPPTVEDDSLPPTPEEIGYTNGIIFFSTILVLILLIATLRETIRREGR